MTTSSPIATAASTNRINAIIARQHSSRIRDLVFAAALTVGVALSLGGIRNAAAHAAAPVAAASAHVVTTTGHGQAPNVLSIGVKVNRPSRVVDGKIQYWWWSTQSYHDTVDPSATVPGGGA